MNNQLLQQKIDMIKRQKELLKYGDNEEDGEE